MTTTHDAWAREVITDELVACTLGARRRAELLTPLERRGLAHAAVRLLVHLRCKGPNR